MGQINSVSVDWQKGMSFSGTSGSGHMVQLDGDKETGASPMEYLLFGLAGCSSVDVVLILEKMRQQVTGCTCEVDGERAEHDPKVYVAITMRYWVTGKGLSLDKVKRAVDLSAEKYCSASVMLGKTAEITHEIEILEG